MTMTHAQIETPVLADAARRFPTVLWNDSADPDELPRFIEFGAVGATCNPVIALAAVKAHLDRWRPRIIELAAQHPEFTESQIGWRVVEELSIEAAALLLPAFRESGGRNGRLSVQTDPRLHRDADALVEQAVHFSGLAENIIVKIPATSVGLRAIEEATYRGVSINVTVSFTVAQAVAAAYVQRERILVDPGVLEWAGVAALKKAHQVFRDRGYRSRVLSAAFRNYLQWSELQGGDLVVSPPFDWQLRIQENGIVADDRIDVPVDERIIRVLLDKVPEFRRAYDVDGMTPVEFDTFGATVRTLRQFLEADEQLDRVVRDILVPAV